MDRIEKIARELFDVWVEAKSTCEDNWDDMTWEKLPEKHKDEYLKTANRICQLFKPEIDESRLLSDEEIKEKLKQETEDNETYEDYATQLGIHLQDAINIARYGAVLELSHCEPLIRADERAKTLREVETESGGTKYRHIQGQEPEQYYEISLSRMEALKKQEGIE